MNRINKPRSDSFSLKQGMIILYCDPTEEYPEQEICLVCCFEREHPYYIKREIFRHRNAHGITLPKYIDNDLGTKLGLSWDGYEFFNIEEGI